MKIIIPGGSGHVGQSVAKRWVRAGHEIVILSRASAQIPGCTVLSWDGRLLGPWQSEFEGADLVLNLAGRSVNCRYHAENLWQMMDSRVDSTRVVGEAISICKSPPTVWMQSSTATIYADTFDRDNDEATGVIGGGDLSDMPSRPGTTEGAGHVDKWRASQAIAHAWESELNQADTPQTRKVAIRSSMIMSTVPGSVFTVMAKLAKFGLGGPAGHGRQFVSWIHDSDFARALDAIFADPNLVGAVNVCSPNPIPNREFNRILRESLGSKFGLPLPSPILELGATILKTESELLLKSRRVVPGRLLGSGFTFNFETWKDAAKDLATHLPQ